MWISPTANKCEVTITIQIDIANSQWGQTVREIYVRKIAS